jgi:hypothetical protein
MSRIGEIVFVTAIVIGVGIFASEHITCWHIPYIVDSCSVK